MMLFVSAIIAIMVGSLSSMREIVKEMEIYRRERMVAADCPLHSVKGLARRIGVFVSSCCFRISRNWLWIYQVGWKLPRLLTLFLATLAGMMLGLLVSRLTEST